MSKRTTISASVLLIAAAFFPLSCSGGSPMSLQRTITSTLRSAIPPLARDLRGPLVTSLSPSQTFKSMPAPPQETTVRAGSISPQLPADPKQADSSGQANNQCFLAMLGSAIEIQPGSYQQIRIMLASDATTVKTNLCGSTANCVTLSSDSSNTPVPLLPSSQSKTDSRSHLARLQVASS